jgi:short subunit dehydrogenase-like uncharacterized protein
MTWMIYGANGYTGDLTAREAVKKGLAPILAGRNAEALGKLGRELGLQVRAFPLDNPQAAAAELYGVKAVLHCAGPFVHTSAPMVAACLATGAHYLDITGEIAVFEGVLARGDDARGAGVALIPGVGFDVVPSDCLAARLAAVLPDATELELAFYTEGGSVSRGTMKTMIESLPHAGAIRRNGRIVPVPIAFDAREIDFGGKAGKRWAMTIPWGDVSTAYHSTGIPNIRVYSGTPPGTIRKMKRFAPLLPLAGWKPVKRFAQRWVERKVTGPSEHARQTARVYLWGQARNAARSVTSTLETPEGYHFTAVSAVASVERVLQGTVQPGAWTPSRAFGADFVASLPGVVVGEIR